MGGADVLWGNWSAKDLAGAFSKKAKTGRGENQFSHKKVAICQKNFDGILIFAHFLHNGKIFYGILLPWTSREGTGRGYYHEQMGRAHVIKKFQGLRSNPGPFLIRRQAMQNWEKQKRFREEYARSKDPYQAALRAGYSEKTARQAGKWVEPGGRFADLADPPKASGMDEICAFWSDVMRDETRDIRERIKASELYAKVEGAFSENKDGGLDGMTVEVRITDE